MKAIIKEWSPGLVEAFSLVDLESTMNGLRGDERVSFEVVCEIAAAITACNAAVRNLLAGVSVALDTSNFYL